MFKKKFIVLFLATLLVLSQMNYLSVFANQSQTDGWDNIEYGDYELETMAPDYYPEDHIQYGGYAGDRDNGYSSSGGNDNSFEDVRNSAKYKLKNNICYLITSTTVKGKTTTTEKQVDISNCISGGGTSGDRNEGGFNDDGLIIYPTEPGKGDNIGDLSEVFTDSDLNDLESSDFETVYDDDGNPTGLRNKKTNKFYAIGEKVTIGNGIVIGVVSSEGKIDYSNAVGPVSGAFTSDLSNLGKGTHGLFYTTDKFNENSQLIDMKITISENGTVSSEDFVKAFTILTEALKGKVVEDKDRMLFFIEGKLLVTVKKSENIHVDLFDALLADYKSGIFAQPFNKK